MSRFVVERDQTLCARGRINADMAAKVAPPGGTPFRDFDREMIATPGEAVVGKGQPIGAATEMPLAILGERPALGGDAIKRDIERGMGERIGAAAAARARVKWGEDATEKRDQREAVTSVVADGVEIPPDIPTGCNRDVEARSASRLVAACPPESAAIGSPAPGCTLPPAR